MLPAGGPHSFRKLKLDEDEEGSWFTGWLGWLSDWWRPQADPGTPGRLRRHGSDLFDRPSGARAARACYISCAHGSMICHRQAVSTGHVTNSCTSANGHDRHTVQWDLL